MDKLGNSILPIEAIDDRTIQPYELLQVNIDEMQEREDKVLHQNYFHHHPHHIQPSPHTMFHPMEHAPKYFYPGFPPPDFDSERWRYLGHSLLEPTNLTTTANQTPAKENVKHKNEGSPMPATSPTPSSESPEQRRARRSLQQRLRRINESAEEKELRKLKNRELNRKRRQILSETGVATEKARNRLRQRVKREITRMLRTSERRDDFIKETFTDVKNYFNDEEYNVMYQRVMEAIDFIQMKNKT